MNSQVLHDFYTMLALMGGIGVGLALASAGVGMVIAKVRERRYLKL